MGIGGKAHATRYKRADKGWEEGDPGRVVRDHGLALHFAYLPILIVDFRSLDVWSGRVGERVE